MPRPSQISRQSDNDESFARAAWDAAHDAELDTRSFLVVELRLDIRRGVWRVESRLERRQDGRAVGVVARNVGEYPNGRAATLSAYLFAHINSLSQMASSFVQEELRKGLRR